MATSGTVSQTRFTTRQVVDNAARRCKLLAPQITADHITIANDALYLLLSDLANQGAPLWCIEKVIYPLYAGVLSVPLGAATVDVLNANLRYLLEVTGTNTDSATEREIEFATETEVTTVGIKWAAASAPIEFARSDDGVTWEVIQTEDPDAVLGEWTWYDMDSVVAALYFRVRATSGVLDFETIYTANTPTEITLSRMNRDDYTNLPNKAFQSNRPLQYWFDRLLPQPFMRLWPVPDVSAETSQIVAWRHRYIMDVGTLTQELEVPQRWFEAVVAMLAFRLSEEFAEVTDMALVARLEAAADKALYIAQQEERDNSPINFAPNISAYTQ